MTVSVSPKTHPYHRKNRKQLLRTIKIAVQFILPDAEVILYGSQARGDASRNLDWDILVLTDAEVTYQLERNLRRKMDDLSLQADVVISAFVRDLHTWMTPLAKTSPYHQNIIREGILI